MAQKKNTSFAGTSFYDVEPDAMSNKDDFANLVGDLAFLVDLAKGVSGTISHSGSGSGCPLNYSLVNQSFADYLITPLEDTDQYVWAAPCFFPPGTNTYQFVVQTNNPLAHNLEIYEAAWVTGESNTGPEVRTSNIPDQEIPLFQTGSNDLRKCTFSIEPGANGKVILLMVRMEGSQDLPAGTQPLTGYQYFNFVCYPVVGQNNTSRANIQRLTSNEYPSSVEADGAAVVLKSNPFDESLFAADYPISGHILTRVNREQNAFTQFLTAAPAGSNATKQIYDSATSNPLVSAFYNHKPSAAGAYGENGYGIFKNIATYGLGNVGALWGDFRDISGGSPIGKVTSGAQVGALLFDFGGFQGQLNIDNGGSTPTKCVLIFIATSTFSPAQDIDVAVQAMDVSHSTAGAVVTTFSVTTPGFYYVALDAPNIHKDVFNGLRVQYSTDTGYPDKTGTNIPAVALVGATWFLRPT